MNSLSELMVENIEIWTSSENAKKSGRGRSTNLRSNLYGTNKLRDLILELAIKGRLVFQDESEDPASNILKKIELDRVKSTALGDRSKRKHASKISHNNESVKLPAGWTIASLSDVAEIIRGITFPGSEKSKLPEPGRIACLRTSNVQDQIDWDDLLYIGENFVSRDNQILRPKDIVMSMANSRELVGKVALINAVSEKTTFGGFLGVLRTTSINPDFLMIFLRAPSTRASLIESSSQTTNIANISLAKLNPLVFAIPPLAEQGRIVAKVNELIVLCDGLEEATNAAFEVHCEFVKSSLNKVARQPNESGVIENFDELFASNIGINGLKDLIISLGVQGRLTHNNQANPDLNTLFVDVKTDRDLQILGGGVRDKGQFIDFDGLDSLKVNIPDSWCWVRLGAIAEVVRGGSPRPAGDIRFYDGHIPFLKVGDVTRSSGKMVEGWTATIKEAGLQKTRLVKGRTVLLTNSGATLGIPAICDFETTFNDGIAAFINLSKFVFDEYLHLYLTHLSDWFLNVAAQGQGQPNLNIDIIRSTWMPLPPIQEQFKIVSKVDELLARCDQLESLVENSSQLKRKIADVIVEQITK
jgi:type I restriction enzyme S subunit